MNKILLPDYLLRYMYSQTYNELCYVVEDLNYNFITYKDGSMSKVLCQLAANGYTVVDSRYLYGGNLYITIKF